MSTIGLYIKAIGTLVVTGLTAYIAALADGDVTSVEWITIVISVVIATAIVWAVPSTPAVFQKWGKAIASAVVAALSSIAVGLTDGNGLSQAEIITAIVAGLTSLGLIGFASNAASSDPYNPATKQVHPVSYDEKAALIGSPPASPPYSSAL